MISRPGEHVRWQKSGQKTLEAEEIEPTTFPTWIGWSNHYLSPSFRPFSWKTYGSGSVVQAAVRSVHPVDRGECKVEMGKKRNRKLTEDNDSRVPGAPFLSVFFSFLGISLRWTDHIIQDICAWQDGKPIDDNEKLSNGVPECRASVQNLEQEDFATRVTNIYEVPGRRISKAHYLSEPADSLWGWSARTWSPLRCPRYLQQQYVRSIIIVASDLSRWWGRRMESGRRLPCGSPERLWRWNKDRRRTIRRRRICRCLEAGVTWIASQAPESIKCWQ